MTVQSVRGTARRDSVSEPARNVRTSAYQEQDLADDLDPPVEDDEAQEADITGAFRSPVRLAAWCGLVIVVLMTGLAGWAGAGAIGAHQARQHHAGYMQAARDGALNFTTMDWRDVDADVQQILDGATGDYYLTFSQGEQLPFLQEIVRSKAVTRGTVTQSGMESETDTEARVLVTVTVETTNEGIPGSISRSWRMRVIVENADDQMKVSRIEIL